MGTNYYAVKNRPTTSSPIHIGKSSSGWLFLFHEYEDKWNEPPVIWHTYNQVIAWLKENTVDSTNYVIIDEYDEIISYDDFINLVDSKQKDDHCRANKDNFAYAKNVDGYRFSNNDFC